MPVQSLPRSAEAYARSQRAESEAAVAAVLRLWSRVTSVDFDSSWRRVRPSVVSTVAVAQRRVAAGAAVYVPQVLAETGQRAAPDAQASASPLVGVAGDGRPLGTLLDGALYGAKVAVLDGVAPAQALADRSGWLSLVVGTVLSDTGRQAESLAAGVRRVGGYTRMLVPPSCSRCAILAGKWFRHNQGFERHPGCDCRHIPASEAVGGDLTVDPHEYFASLSEAEQDRIFTRAGAEAIRNGADVGQVVNARRGMRTAQIAGRDLLVATEGTTRHGWASARLGTTAGGRRPRLMPETIAQVATDHQDYLRLLRANHYII